MVPLNLLQKPGEKGGNCSCLFCRFKYIQKQKVVSNVEGLEIFGRMMGYTPCCKGNQALLPLFFPAHNLEGGGFFSLFCLYS